MAEYSNRKVIALYDKPSTESFGMAAIIAEYGQEQYEVLGFSTGAFYITKFYLEQKLGGHILQVSSPLPIGIDVPTALWLGNEFRMKANRFNVPELPQIDEDWFAPLQPYQHIGHYAVRDSNEVYKVLDDWTRLAGIQALKENNRGIASLMNWVLPLSPITEAVGYFTAANETERQKVLGWQTAIGSKKRTAEELIQQHERTRYSLLSGA